MSEITNSKIFKKAVDSLPIKQQRLIASQFIAGVLDLTDDDRLMHAQTVAADPNATEDDYIGSYKYAKHIAVETSQYEWNVVVSIRYRMQHMIITEGDTVNNNLILYYQTSREHELCQKSLQMRAS